MRTLLNSAIVISKLEMDPTNYVDSDLLHNCCESDNNHAWHMFMTMALRKTKL